MAADLNRALEVNLHAIGEFERLEVGIRENGCRRAEVLDLGELAHQFGSRYAAALVHQLDGSSFAVVGKTVPDKHVEFVLLVLDGQNHGHSLADLDDSGHFASPRSCLCVRLCVGGEMMSWLVRTFWQQVTLDGSFRCRPKSDALDWSGELKKERTRGA